MGACIVLKEGYPLSTCLPLGSDLFLHVCCQEVWVITCIDCSGICQKVCMDNPLPVPEERCHHFSCQTAPPHSLGFGRTGMPPLAWWLLVVASLSQGHTAAAQCGLFTHKSVPVIFEPPCSCELDYMGTLYCVTTCVTFHSGNFPWWQGAQWLVLFSLLCFGVHTVLPSVLQSMLGVYLSYLKKVLEAVHFGLQTCFVQNKHAVHCTLKLLLMTLKTLSTGCLPSGHLYPATFLTSRTCMGSDWTNKETTVLCLHFCHHNHSGINV